VVVTLVVDTLVVTGVNERDSVTPALSVGGDRSVSTRFPRRPVLGVILVAEFKIPTPLITAHLLAN